MATQAGYSDSNNAFQRAFIDSNVSGGQGALSGAAVGGIYGAVIGGSIAATQGLITGFTQAPTPKFQTMQSIIDQRNNQINAFQQSLSAAQGNIMANYQNLQANTMARFAPTLAASLGARGITASSGAFQSGVGQEATALQGQYDMANANMTESNLMAINQAQSQMFGPQFQLATTETAIPYQQGQYNQSMMQNAFGSALKAAGSTNWGNAFSGQQTTPNASVPGGNFMSQGSPYAAPPGYNNPQYSITPWSDSSSGSGVDMSGGGN